MFLSNKLNWTVSTSLVIRERKRSYEKLFWLVLLVHRCLIEVHGVPKLWIHVRMLSSSVALGHRELRRSNGKLFPLYTVLFGNLAYAFSLLKDKLSWNSCRTMQKHKCYSRYLIALGSSTISFTTWKKIDILSLQ